MKNVLLTLLATAACGAAVAQTPQLHQMKDVEMASIRFDATKTIEKSALTVAEPWSESFEAWPDKDKGYGEKKDYFWLPEGWTRKATEAYMTEENPHTWFVNTKANEYVPGPVDGDVYMEIMYNDAPQDEWIYTCELTPQVGDWLQYYVLFRPFMLYDYSKFDHKEVKYSEYVVVGNLQTYISVDGGEYQLVGDLAEEYKSVPVQEIYDLYLEGYVNKKQVSIDMAQYVGHTVKVGFRYVATDGDSMWLDALTLGKPSMTVGYDMPASTLFMGMPMDMSDVPAMAYLPDNTHLSWNNASSLEARMFEWTYPTAGDYSVMQTSTDANLTARFDAFTAEKTAEDVQKNIVPVPVLKAKGIGGLEGEYTSPLGSIKVGGKAQMPVDGKLVRTGASTCDPTKGIDVIATEGYPLFGNISGEESPWTRILGIEGYGTASVTAVLAHFPEPDKKAKIRGLWIQCVGELTAAHRLSVGAYRRNVYGSLDEAPVAKAIIDIDNIYKEASPASDGTYYYSIPFLFPDPLEVDEALWYKLEGMDKAFSIFAPLQTKDPSAECHAFIDVTYTIEGETGTNTYAINNLSIGGVPCNNSFYFNLDMAYGDCDEWGHLDVTVPEPEMPEITITKNSMKLVNLDNDERQERVLPMRCGFYDEKEDSLTLYACIGELYAYEEGPFYTDDLTKTYYYEIKMPKSLLGTDTAIGEGTGVSVRYYDIILDEWTLEATSGTLKVVKTDNGTYTIDLAAMDVNRYNATKMNFESNEAWRWRKYGEMRPNPNEYKLSRSGKYYEVHPVNSCVVDMTDEEVAHIYFCETPNVRTVEGMKNLPADAAPAVVIDMSKERMDGNYLSFSMTRNNRSLVLNVAYEGNVYDCDSKDIDGGNVCVDYINEDLHHISISSMLFSLQAKTINGGYPNWSLKYEGMYTPVEVPDNIDGVVVERHDVDNVMYNLCGQRVNAAKGIVIINGKKYRMSGSMH